MPKFKKKPVVIEAIQYDGDNFIEIHAKFPTMHVIAKHRDNSFEIGTLEGSHIASVGDWIIRGVKGEFYPCKPDIFQMTYEPCACPPEGHP